MPSNLLKNFFSLSWVQVVNQLVPLLVLPLVLRRIELEAFAVEVFEHSLAAITSGLANYGFLYTSGASRIIPFL